MTYKSTKATATATYHRRKKEHLAWKQHKALKNKRKEKRKHINTMCIKVTLTHTVGVGWKSEMERERKSGREREGETHRESHYVNACEWMCKSCVCVCVRAMVPWLMLQLIFIHTVYTLAREQAKQSSEWTNERANELNVSEFIQYHVYEWVWCDF